MAGPRARTGSGTWKDRLYRGDARTVLAGLPADSVHLAITSPPYNVKIPYRGYSDDLPLEEYLAWLKGVWAELRRVLVPGGRFVLNVAPTSIKDFRPIHHDLSRDLRDLGYIMRTEILWYKQTMGRRTAWGSWRSPSNPHIVPSWEYVLVFSKEQWRLEGEKDRIDITAREFERFSDGFWPIPPERRRNGHPAPFPEELIERLVKFYSYRENVVLDMFGGTGTVAAVARRLGRHYVHIDASDEYCRSAAARVLAAVPPPGTPIPAPTVVGVSRRGRRADPAAPPPPPGPLSAPGRSAGRATARRRTRPRRSPPPTHRP
ncbi:MAG TPA: site-specific DNA-methyltransferase [Thermoplasmata archaeon]|nr:site-specific DNA-methyltransferase [Thermoplasmata archaeon]